MSEKILHSEEVAYLDFLNLVELLHPVSDVAITARIVDLQSNESIYNEAFSAITYFDPTNTNIYKASNVVVKRLSEQEIVFDSMEKFSDEEFNEALINFWRLYQNLDVLSRTEFFTQTNNWLNGSSEDIPILTGATVKLP